MKEITSNLNMFERGYKMRQQKILNLLRSAIVTTKLEMLHEPYQTVQNQGSLYIEKRDQFGTILRIDYTFNSLWVSFRVLVPVPQTIEVTRKTSTAYEIVEDFYVAYNDPKTWATFIGIVQTYL